MGLRKWIFRKWRKAWRQGQREKLVLLRLSACHLSRIPFQWCQTLSLKVSFCYLVDFGSFEMSCICALCFCTSLDLTQMNLLCWVTISETKCFASGKPAKKWALWGRSYWLKASACSKTVGASSDTQFLVLNIIVCHRDLILKCSLTLCLIVIFLALQLASLYVLVWHFQMTVIELLRCQLIDHVGTQKLWELGTITQTATSILYIDSKNIQNWMLFVMWIWRSVALQFDAMWFWTIFTEFATLASEFFLNSTLRLSFCEAHSSEATMWLTRKFLCCI